MKSIIQTFAAAALFIGINYSWHSFIYNKQAEKGCVAQPGFFNTAKRVIASDTRGIFFWTTDSNKCLIGYKNPNP